jgi:hypothetical protein
LEVTVNVQALEELKRVLAAVPDSQFDMTRWHSCACGHATQDDWFVSRGFTSCNDFRWAATFFQITRRDAELLFSGRKGRNLSPAAVSELVDEFLKMGMAGKNDEEAQWVRRQAILDGLLAKANNAARSARRIATSLIAVFF